MEGNPKKAKSKSPDTGESKKKKKQKEKKEKHQNVMKQLPSSAFSCSAHPTQYLKIIPKQNKNPPTCKSCGFKLQGKFGYFTCPKSASCYFLCSTCKVCSQNHMLRNVISLKQFSKDDLSKENKYKCHGCQQEKIVSEEKGVWYCSPCSFSICPECMQHTDTMWEELNVEE